MYFKNNICLPRNKISNNVANYSIFPPYNRQYMIINFKYIIKTNP